MPPRVKCLTMHISVCIIERIEFTCNPVKNETNIRDRGLPLLAARVMFNPAMVVREDTRKTYPERRFIGYNTVAGRLMVVFCVAAADHVHIISFRKANDREQRKFETQSP
ncbi:MAG: BrnT family toxin [Betaproteobacteria bacterium]|nr:BrnT family toxin [Betaproteobacteria bacterium]